MTNNSNKTTDLASYSKASQVTKLISDLGFLQNRVIFMSDETIWKNSQKFFPQDFLEKNGKNLILKNPKPDEDNLKKIADAAKDYDLILALGSGTINDLCKFTSAKSKIPYAIFASAASMNGYLSKNASIIISGHRKTLAATLPIAVFCDLEILKSAPIELTKAGIGDSMCFYSCWFDWYLSHKILGTKFDIKPFEILRQEMNFFVKNFQKFSINDEELLKLLIEILLLSGRGMTIAGGSYPASQSEHLIAHAINMKHPENSDKTLHGAQIAVTSLTSAKLQKKIIDLQTPPQLMANVVFPQKQIEEFFNKELAEECEKEFNFKTFSSIRIEEINGNLQKKWPEINQELQKIHFSELDLRNILTHFGIEVSPSILGLTKEEYQCAISNAQFIRDRFTCLDLTFFVSEVL